MKKYWTIYLWLPLLLVIVLFGCDKETSSLPTTTNETYTLTLQGDELIDTVTMNGLTMGEIVQLPRPDLDNYVFVGWSDGENTYNPEYVVLGDQTLVPVLENASDVFVYQTDSHGYVSITRYTGEADYLKIPMRIDSQVVMAIEAYAFKDTDHIGIEIPATVRVVGEYAFSGMLKLESFAYYGVAELEGHYVIGNAMYQMWMADGVFDSCVVSSINEAGDHWTYEEGCFVSEITSEEKVVNDVTYINYSLTYDYRYAYNDYYNQIYEHALDGDVHLTSLTLSPYFYAENFEAFHQLPALTKITIDERNPHFVIEKDIVYSKDMTELWYYPNHLKASTFEIPETVTSVGRYAFGDNPNLEVIKIPDTLEDIHDTSFAYLSHLKAYDVSQNNPYMADISGVLVGSDGTLLAYPASREYTEYHLPESVTAIGPMAFAYNRYLVTLDLGETITSIDTFAFAKTKSLLELDIPASVTVLGNTFVSDTDSITKVTLHRSGVTDGTITVLTEKIPSTGTITYYVPDDSVNLYRNDQYWWPVDDEILPISMK